MKFNLRDNPILSAGYDYWRGKCGFRTVPDRRDVDPTEIPRHVLPYVQLTDVLNDGQRFRYRLVGTAIVDAYGAELTGKYYDEVLPAERLRLVEETYCHIAVDRKPRLACNRFVSTLNLTLVSARLIMPLSSDGAEIRHWISVISFQYPGRAIDWTGQWLGIGDRAIFDAAYTEIVDDEQ